MTAALDRDEILRRFQALLDAALASEDEPAGIDPDILSAVLSGGDSEQRNCDSYTLWSAMTALTQEIKLQGRAFQELNQTIGAQTEKIAGEMRAIHTERERTLQREAERRCRKEALSALIDLRDRLSRGRDTVRAREVEIAGAAQAGLKKRWWERMFAAAPVEDPAGEAVSALVRGYELGLERLDQTLDEWSAREIRCQGESFDPKRMNAIESEESSAVPPGTVLEVYRSGYEWNGEVYRPAQVKVSRAAANPELT
jgi:molecular chaperone GrpE